MLTDFSGWTICCESEAGGACSEEKCNYVRSYPIYIYMYMYNYYNIIANLYKIIAICTMIFSYINSGCGLSIKSSYVAI